MFTAVEGMELSGACSLSDIVYLTAGAHPCSAY